MVADLPPQGQLDRIKCELESVRVESPVTVGHAAGTQ